MWTNSELETIMLVTLPGILYRKFQSALYSTSFFSLAAGLSTVLFMSKWDIHVSMIRFLKFGNCLNIFQFILFRSSHCSSFSGRAGHWAQNGGWLSRSESIMSGKLQPCPQGAREPCSLQLLCFPEVLATKDTGTKINCGFKRQIPQGKTVYAFLRFFYNFNFFLAATL